MNNVTQATWVELFKARRSKMPLLTGLGFLMIPFVGGFFMIVLKDPELARRSGMISAKAQMLAGVADWPTYLESAGPGHRGRRVDSLQPHRQLGLWPRVFRPHGEGSAGPAHRPIGHRGGQVRCDRHLVCGAWLASSISSGWVSALQWTCLEAATSVIGQGSARLAITAGLTIISITPILFFASAGHGYLPPMGVAILAIFLSQIIAVAGYGEYFPWSIPALYAQGDELGAISFVIVGVTGIVGVVATFLWWEMADQTQ